MKLQAFLKEESLSSQDISVFTKGLDEKSVKCITEILAKFKSYTNISLTDISEDEMFFHVSNGLVDFDFSFDKMSGTKDGKLQTFSGLEIASMINEKYIFEPERFKDQSRYLIALSQTFSQTFWMSSDSQIDRVHEKIDKLLKLAQDFDDWYFDITEKHGKVKLVKITLDLADGASSNNIHKWTPYLGQFSANDDHQSTSSIV